MRILFLGLLFFILTTVYSFAATIGENGTTIGTEDFKASKGVTITAFSSDTDYAAQSKHTNGKKYYCTSADEQVVDNGATDPGISTATDTCN